MSNDVNNNNGDGHDKDKDKDYEVGFCKPPKATQFQKGQSGNPKGRPKGSKNKKTVLGALRMAHKDFRDVIMDEAMKEVEVKENGEIVTTSKLRLVAGQLMNKGIRGETRAAREAIRLAEKAILDEHKDVARFIEAERREREQLKQLWLHHSKTADEEISDDGEIRHETGHSAFVQMMAIYDRFMDKKSMRFALGEDKVPYEDFEPRNEEEWTMLRNHITDLYHEVEEPRPWFKLDSARYRKTQFAREQQEKLLELYPEHAEKLKELWAKQRQKDAEEEAQNYPGSSD